MILNDKTHPEGRISVIASLTALEEALPAALEMPEFGAAGVVPWIEVRADLLGSVDVEWLRARTGSPLLFTLRSRAEGGACERSAEERALFLKQAADQFDAVDLEAERDLSADVLAAVPAERRVLSWHAAPGTHDTAEGLNERLRAMDSVPAALYKLIPSATRSGHELPALELLRKLGRQDVLAFATGAVASWTRVVAPTLGAPVMFAAFGDQPAAPGQLALSALVSDFGFPYLPKFDWACGIVGSPVSHSLSPRLHNGAYRALGLPGLYLPFEAAEFGHFWLEVVESDFWSGAEEASILRGLSVTAPHKRAALAIAGASSPLAQRIDSANTLVRSGCDRRGRVWEAESTDPEGVLGGLAAAGVVPAGRRAAVVGCGGAGRAAAAGLAAQGAELVVVNRSQERGEQLATLLGVPFIALADFDPSRFEILVNATSVGSGGSAETPWRVNQQKEGTAVVEMVYGKEPTALEEQARAFGPVITGRDVLLHQAATQFRLMTGEALPMEIAAELLAGKTVAGVAKRPGAALQ